MFAGSEEISRAINGLSVRAEKLIDGDDVIGSYVDIGIMSQMNSDNDQIIFGRRGTGKTHLFKYMGNKLSSRESSSFHNYVDLRVLASASDSILENRSIEERAYSIIRDFTKKIVDEIKTQSSNFRDYRLAIKLLEDLEDASNGIEIIKEPLKSIESNSSGFEGEVGGSVGLKGVGLNGKIKKEGTQSNNTEFTFSKKSRVRFSFVSNALNNLLNSLGVKYYLLIDEWSSIPESLQPHLAEFIKRVFLSENRCIVKIAAIRTRSNFFRGGIGIEIGADMTRCVDIDEFLLFDKNEKNIIGIYKKIIYSHLELSLDIKTLYQLKISKIEDMMNRLFSNELAFVELVLSSNGVVRDFMDIFSAATNYCIVNELNKIEIKVVRTCGDRWYRKEKKSNLTNKENNYLNMIVKFCLKNKSRIFSLPLEGRELKIINNLVDKRVLHMFSENVVVNESERDLYTIDYGAYVGELSGSDVSNYRARDFCASTKDIKPFPGIDKWIRKVDINLKSS